MEDPPARAWDCFSENPIWMITRGSPISENTHIYHKHFIVVVPVWKSTFANYAPPPREMWKLYNYHMLHVWYIDLPT